MCRFFLPGKASCIMGLCSLLSDVFFMEPTNKNHRIPVTVLSGFLGSGKTTLLNHLLDSLNRRRIAVIENELGEIPIDHDLVLHADLEQLETIQGRTCCETREQFIELLHRLARVRSRFDRILIETTGVAHPGMVAHAILADPFLKEHLQIDGIIAVVDALHILQHLGEEGHAAEQIAYADLIVINKVDLVSPQELDRVTDAVIGINSIARRYFAENASVPTEELLNIGGFDLKRVENGVSGCVGSKISLHKSGHKIETIAVTLKHDLDPQRFNDWINDFINDHSADLFRCKGILALNNCPERLVFHGVHGVFRLTLGEPWLNQERTSRAVFIGRNLSRDLIQSGMEGCRS